MLIIENKSKDTIKSYNFKLEKNGKSIIKTEKDFPISKIIEIKIDLDEIKKSNLDSASAKLTIVYSNGKKHTVESSNLKFATTDINVTTYGSAKKLNINTKNLLSEEKVNYTENQYFTMIQNLVDTYMKQYPVDGGGKDGADGKSAYDVAVDDGFTGTKAEWLESLKGNGFENMTKAEMLSVLRGE